MTRKVYYNKEQAARELSVSVPTIERLMSSGRMRTEAIGSRHLLPASEVRRVSNNKAQILDSLESAGPATHQSREMKRCEGEAERKPKGPGKSFRTSSGPSQEESRRTTRDSSSSQNESDDHHDYYPITTAAQKLNKSVTQVKKKIEAGELRFKYSKTQVMVLRQDVDLLLKGSGGEPEKHRRVVSGEYKHSYGPSAKGKDEPERDEVSEDITSFVGELEEELSSLWSQIASERELWNGRLEQERRDRQVQGSGHQEEASRLRKEAYAIQEELEQERSKRKKLDEDAQAEIDALDEELRALKEELEKERAGRLAAQWEVQELKVELEEVQKENDPLMSVWERLKVFGDRVNAELGEESSKMDGTGHVERIESLQSELQEEKQRREENESWIKDLQSAREGLQSEVEKERAYRESLANSLQAAKREHEEYVQKLMKDKEQAIAQAREKAREFENDKNLLDEIRRVLGSQPTSEIPEMPAAAENEDEAREYALDTPDGRYRLSVRSPLEDGDLELLQLVARYGELTADQLRNQTGDRRAPGKLNHLLDYLEEQGVNVIEMSEDRYRLDVTRLQGD